MTLRLRRQPLDFGPHEPARYVVLDGERIAGAIYHDPNASNGPRWVWQITIPPEGGGSAPGGQADTLEDAMAAFRAAWDGYEPRQDWPPAGGTAAS
jgi:hypothetical protein